MRDLKFKFIIDDGELILRKCVFHRELAWAHKSGDDDNTVYPTVIGGGWWYWDREKNRIYLYSKSEQFKACTKEQILAALPKTIEEDTAHFNHYFAGNEIYFSTSDSLGDAMQNGELIFTVAERPVKI